jgi:hypothetical protein
LKLTDELISQLNKESREHQHHCDPRRRGPTHFGLRKALSRLFKGRRHYLDLYTTAAVADLIALTFGEEEKAVFLSRLEPNVVDSLAAPHPALVNFYLQLSFAMQKSSESWPRREMIEKLEKTYSLTEAIIAAIRTSKENHKNDSLKNVVKELGLNEPPDTSYDDLLNYYEYVRFRILDLYLGLFNDIALDPQQVEIDGWQRQRWRALFNEIEAILLSRTHEPTIFKENPAFELAKEDRARWAQNPYLANAPRVTFNAYMDLALGSLLVERSAPSREACMLASYAFSRARTEEATAGFSGSTQIEAEGNIRRIRDIARTQIKNMCPDGTVAIGTRE